MIFLMPIDEFLLFHHTKNAVKQKNGWSTPNNLNLFGDFAVNKDYLQQCCDYSILHIL